MVKRYLWRDRHGKPRVRKNGKTYPIRDENGIWHEPDTAEGDRIYWEIVTGKRAEAKRSWSAAIKILRDSDRWAGCRPAIAPTLSQSCTISKTRSASGTCRV